MFKDKEEENMQKVYEKKKRIMKRYGKEGAKNL